MKWLFTLAAAHAFSCLKEASGDRNLPRGEQLDDARKRGPSVSGNPSGIPCMAGPFAHHHGDAVLDQQTQLPMPPHAYFSAFSAPPLLSAIRTVLQTYSLFSGLSSPSHALRRPAERV